MTEVAGLPLLFDVIVGGSQIEGLASRVLWKHLSVEVERSKLGPLAIFDLVVFSYFGSGVPFPCVPFIHIPIIICCLIIRRKEDLGQRRAKAKSIIYASKTGGKGWEASRDDGSLNGGHSTRE